MNFLLRKNNNFRNLIFSTMPSMEFPTQEPLSLQILVLISFPVPHVTEHVDHSDHSNQSLPSDLEPPELPPVAP